MLQVSGLTKAYGSRTLFENVTFAMGPGERLGLVGRNGCGKSTLFKLILGSESPDEGEIFFPRGYRVGHLAQHLEFHEPTILKEVCLGLPEEERDQEYRGEIMLAGLGFSQADMARPPSDFSGGFQIRLNLAKLLLSEPNLLLLDEPTNYLDIVSMRWLTSFLRSWKNELIIISHDRLFMDGVTTHTMLIHRGNVRKIEGGTEKLYTRVELDEENYEKQRINEDKKRKELEAFITRFRAQASKAALVQSKVKALERMGQKEELQDEEALDFQFCEEPFAGKQMIDITDLSFGYPGGPTLVKNLSLSIKKGDRIGIIGKNGKGKSTLLKLIYGELTPDSGSVVTNQNARIGYFGQTNIARLNPALTVEQEISNANQKHFRTKVRAICGTVMFSGDDALKKIAVLSGGERSRVLLGKILATPTNVLLLDEPTNHLDMESIEALIKSLSSYEGAVVVVTHSELILGKLANRLVAFDGDAPRVIDHGYDYFLEKEGWGDEEQMSSSSTPNKKSKDKGRSDEKQPTSKLSNNALKALQKQMASVEDRITTLEAEIKTAEDELTSASEAGNIELITSLSYRLSDLHEEVNNRFAELEKLSTQTRP